MSEADFTSPQGFSRKSSLGFKVQKASFSLMGVKLAPPI